MRVITWAGKTARSKTDKQKHEKDHRRTKISKIKEEKDKKKVKNDENAKLMFISKRRPVTDRAYDCISFVKQVNKSHFYSIFT